MTGILKFILCLIGWGFLWVSRDLERPYSEICIFIGGMLLITYGMIGD